MKVETFCIVPDEVLFSYIKENCANARHWAKLSEAHGGHAVLVGGGPSLRSRLSSIKARQDHGQKVFAMNGAAKFLADNGIFPDYQVLLDPQDFVTEFIGPAKDHLVASQCHPSVLRALPDATLWHLAVDGVNELIPDRDEDFCLVGGGITVGHSAMYLAYSMGFRNIHCYGFDSSFAFGDKSPHAYSEPNETIAELGKARLEAGIVTASVGTQKFATTLGLFQQAETFPETVKILSNFGCIITIDCDGLLRAIVEHVNKEAAEAA